MMPEAVRILTPDGLVQKRSTRLIASLCFAVALVGLLLSLTYCSQRWQAVFFTTSSPGHTYEVRLKGNKGRPLLIPNEVSVDVLKASRPFLSDLWLHSTSDSFDLSFEAGYPDVRWRSENVVEFYRKEYYDRGLDSLILTNRASKSIQWLRVQSVNKHLIFEMPTGNSIQLEMPAPRGDSQWIGVEGAFTDGKKIEFSAKSFDRKNSQSKRSTYDLVITDSAVVIDNQ
jgi:hypothetical protein